MSTEITCPNCHTHFALEDVITEDVEKSLKRQYEQRLQESIEKLNQERNVFVQQQKDFEEKKKRENEIFLEKLEKEKQKMQQELQEQIRKSMAGDYENKMKLMKQTIEDHEEKLKLAREKEMEVLQLQHKLKEQKDEMDLELQKKLFERTKDIEAKALKHAQEEQDLKLKEKEHQIEQMKKLIEEMKRKSEQSSMQLQGEVQELALEDMLRSAFPYDTVSEIKKGVQGADTIQEVKNHGGQSCGTIIYESKRTQNFSEGWIEKLKTDMLNARADIAIIVTQAMPKDMEQFGQRKGIWICKFQEAVGLAFALREGLIKIRQAEKNNENKGEKKEMIYAFVTSNEFRQQVDAIVEGFKSLKDSISRERLQMEKIWKEREKQIDRVLLNTTHMYGSFKGIAGADIGNVKLLEGGEE